MNDDTLYSWLVKRQKEEREGDWAYYIRYLFTILFVGFILFNFISIEKKTVELKNVIQSKATCRTLKDKSISFVRNSSDEKFN